MGQHCGQLSSRVMNNMGHMDTDGFIRHLAGLERYMSVDESMSLGHIGS
jgi:hypothetical protein